MQQKELQTKTSHNFWAGGIAGMTVDAFLFPIDAIKTRLQAKPENVKPSRSIYFGLTSTLLGSFPSAACFFSSYEASKIYLKKYELPLPVIHTIAASTAEVCTCAVRVPFEVVKQQMQIGIHNSLKSAAKSIFYQKGIQGFFVGYTSTVAREIPFDSLEFVLWESLKEKFNANSGSPQKALISAFSGTLAGGIAAAVTTPLDVAKTRLMTQSTTSEYTGLLDCLHKIWKNEGLSKLFLGIAPRVLWISLGGFVFFGSFELYKYLIETSFISKSSNPHSKYVEVNS